METSLHRQLKQLYAAGDARQEVVLEQYRIDVVVDGRLIEIQHGALAAIRDEATAQVGTATAEKEGFFARIKDAFTAK